MVAAHMGGLASLDWDRRIKLDKPGTQRDLARHGVELVDGLRLVLWDYDGDKAGNVDDLIGVGAAVFDGEEGRWVAEGRFTYPHFQDIIHFSELDPKSKERYRVYRRENGSPA